MSEHVVHITDINFAKDVLKSDKPVLVDFWADWCAPCKAIAPVLEEIAKEYTGNLKVAKLNVDESPESAAKYQIRGIPTLILFKNGIVEATKIGALTKSQLKLFIDNNL